MRRTSRYQPWQARRTSTSSARLDLAAVRTCRGFLLLGGDAGAAQTERAQRELQSARTARTWSTLGSGRNATTYVGRLLGQLGLLGRIRPDKFPVPPDQSVTEPPLTRLSVDHRHRKQPTETTWTHATNSEPRFRHNIRRARYKDSSRPGRRRRYRACSFRFTPVPNDLHLDHAGAGRVRKPAHEGSRHLLDQDRRGALGIVLGDLDQQFIVD
jgi:hypothetical protein